MKKIIVALALVLGLGTVAVAQETTQQPKTEKSCCKKDKKSCKKMEKKCTCKTDGKCTCKTESNPTCACKADMKAEKKSCDAKGSSCKSEMKSDKMNSCQGCGMSHEKCTCNAQIVLLISSFPLFEPWVPA